MTGVDHDMAVQKAQEALKLAAETEDPKRAQAVAVISTHWLALASIIPDPATPGITAEGYQ